MEPLRSQLADTQGELTKKTLQVRQLRADHKTALNNWALEKQGFAEKLQQLENEVKRLRQSNAAAGDSAKLPPRAREDGKQADGTSYFSAPISEGVEKTRGGDDDTVVITRSRMQEVESRFKKVTNELAEKTKLCEDLQRRVQAQGGNPDGAGSCELTDDQIKERWQELRAKIRTLSVEQFNDKIQPKLVPEKGRAEFEHLSAQWKSYMTSGHLTSYIFRALIWRYLYTCLFDKYCRVWGKEHGDAATKLSGLFSSKASDTDFQEWRMHTGRMFHKVCAPDQGVVNDVTTKIFDAIAIFATGTDTEALKKTVKEIVAAAAELSTIFARSRFSALMSDSPGSTLTHGFPCNEAIMEVKGKFGSDTTVDIMISPCLLKKEAHYTVLVKAEVIC
ncbi:hypothetical protein GGS26DRAFT_536615 [Hypomontagnella submonticulosa]|nr:hypothetical protein GGS26DRAFT_536615 [Hypomontagnella submonticulosa]